MEHGFKVLGGKIATRGFWFLQYPYTITLAKVKGGFTLSLGIFNILHWWQKNL